MLYDDSSTLSRHELWAVLKAKNVVRATISFSGGNDEGGADTIMFTHKDGTTSELDAWVDCMTEKWDHATRKVVTIVVPKEKRDLAALVNALTAPIYDAYGSFCGEFSVYGTLTYDVAERTAKMDKNEQSGYDHDESYV